jgi:hypothetical protein
MPSAAEVNPAKFSEITVLFDDGEYSVISGLFEHKRQVLGERWNGSSAESEEGQFRGGSLGFPNVSGHAVWHVVPDFLEIPILHGLLDRLASQPHPQEQEYTGAILRELRRRRTP